MYTKETSIFSLCSYSVMVSITKFSILIGHPRAYFLRNWREVTRVSNYSYLITTFSDRIAVIGHLRCSPVNHFHLNFIFCLFLHCFKLKENVLDVLSTKQSI